MGNGLAMVSARSRFAPRTDHACGEGLWYALPIGNRPERPTQGATPRERILPTLRDLSHRMRSPFILSLQKRPAIVAVLLSSLLLLASCGDNPKPVDPTATVQESSPTLAPGEVTVDSLLQRIDAAWAKTTSMSAISWTAPQSDPMAGIGTPPANETVTTERVIKPASRSISMSIGGAVADEQIAINGNVYFRGTSVSNGIAPFIDTSTWIKVSPTSVAADSPIGQQLTYLTAAPAPPYGTVSADLRARGAVHNGQVRDGDRTCDIYTFQDRTDGTGIIYTLAIDAQDLPCYLLQSGGGYANITAWTFDDPAITIVAPANAIDISATPTPPA